MPTTNLRQRACFATIVDGNIIWAALRDLVPYGQFEKRDKHPWSSVTVKVAPRVEKTEVLRKG